VTVGSVTFGTGIAVVGNSTVIGGIVNSGSISSEFDGIVVSSSKIVGSASGAIANTGSIAANTFGIVVTNSTVTGGISNHGTISSKLDGIVVSDGSTIDGGIVNSGSITAKSVAGIFVSESKIVGSASGAIAHTGSIAANTFGIFVANSTVTGGISNSGSIAGKVVGIDVFATSLGGAISNSGTISSAGGVFGGVTFGTGIAVLSFTESGGSVADLAVGGSDVDSFTTSFGARASTRIDAGANGVLVPEAHAIWQREYLDDRAKVGAASRWRRGATSRW
jgi:hypothetical protein